MVGMSARVMNWSYKRVWPIADSTWDQADDSNKSIPDSIILMSAASLVNCVYNLKNKAASTAEGGIFDGKRTVFIIRFISFASLV
jgi:hypothetical protein